MITLLLDLGTKLVGLLAGAVGLHRTLHPPAGPGAPAPGRVQIGHFAAGGGDTAIGPHAIQIDRRSTAPGIRFDGPTTITGAVAGHDVGHLTPPATP